MNKGRGALCLLSICLSAVTLVHVPSAYSAEETSSTEEVEEKSSETPAMVQEPDSVEETPGEQQPNKESPDVFDPSEEISEDFAVAFPVDI